MADWVCTACHSVGRPRTKTRGLFAVEVLLWMCFLIPGFLYTLWRVATRYKACARCEAAVIPLDSPRGRELSRGAS